MTKNLFDEFVGQEVKAPYRDGSQFKIARGTLKEINNGFLKIVGRLGTIIINEKNVEKMALVRNKGGNFNS
jgi:hypothetical protein